ncbi:DMT family transporter [Acinetobacter sp. S40]|uniref:DMT family transporter n=1 Tax=unclassified Acinetobacter TaxID=196816 RepID=UPI00190C0DFA|nr:MULTISPECIES: DMT family transporter [unclassified Acinetobacter]MBJ9985161.1 DMT family transporter [Acinetobacter sp. S40]MBK0063352.1 DMT family transporter [Acinetobacter sp. S55]MBK0066736.1 DMT family transporter [Acinetobacter sp. S54]
MQFIIFSALCSVSVSILLKWLKEKGFEPIQMIVWNYVSASLMCFIWFKPDLGHLSIQHTPWWLIIVLGLILPSIFLCLAKSLQFAGIIKTELAQRLSVVLSLLAAYFIFHENFNTLKIVGIGLGLAAVLSIILAKGQSQNSSNHHKAMIALIGVWVGYAFVDILLKYTSSLGLQFSVTLNLIFMASFIFSFIYVGFVLKQAWLTKNMLAGLILGMLNFTNIALYVKAHMLLKDSPAIVFAGMNILVVVFGILSGLILFREKTNWMTVLGLILGLAGVICLAQAI